MRSNYSFASMFLLTFVCSLLQTSLNAQFLKKLQNVSKSVDNVTAGVNKATQSVRTVQTQVNKADKTIDFVQPPKPLLPNRKRTPPPKLRKPRQHPNPSPPKRSRPPKK